MKLVRFECDGRIGVGVEESGHVFPLATTSLSDVLQDPLTYRSSARKRSELALESLKLLAPVEPHNKIFAVALNYEGHIREARQSRPECPIVFLKTYDSLVGGGDPIRIPTITKQLDYEGELAIVIGRESFQVSPQDAFGCIAGITAFNDTSARDLLKVPAGTNVMLDWFSSKCMDRSTAIGPVIVTLDEVEAQLRKGELSVVTRINGHEVQNAKTRDMIFDIPTLVSFISSRVRLRPGDLIATGTPPGVGVSMNKFLAAGDVVEIDIAPVPVLRNAIASG